VWGEPRTRVPRCGRSQPALTRGSRTPVIAPARYRCAPQRSLSTSPIRFRRLRLSPYRERLVMLCLFHIFQPFGYYGFGTLAALVLVSRGYDVTSSLLFTAVSYIGYPIGSLLSIPLLNRFERKYLVMASVAAMAVFGLLFATVPSSALIVVFGFLTTAMSNVFTCITPKSSPAMCGQRQWAGRIRYRGCPAERCRSSSSQCSTATAPQRCSRWLLPLLRPRWP